MNQLYNALSSIGLCFILSPACHTTTQAQELLTLEEAIQIGLENNLAIQPIAHMIALPSSVQGNYLSYPEMNKRVKRYGYY